MSSAILAAASGHNGNKTIISVLELMKWFENVGGESRLHLIRLLELIDRNMNGMISKQGFNYNLLVPLNQKLHCCVN